MIIQVQPAPIVDAKIYLDSHRYTNILPEREFAGVFCICILGKVIQLIVGEERMLRFQSLFFIGSKLGSISWIVHVAVFNEAFCKLLQQNVTRRTGLHRMYASVRDDVRENARVYKQDTRLFLSAYIYTLFYQVAFHAASKPRHTSPATADTSSCGVLMQAAAAAAGVGLAQ
jgi:hypothetical protein